MKKVKVLGPGCKRCMTAAAMVQVEADKLGCENASNFDPRSHMSHPADFAIKISIPRGSRSAPIVTRRQPRKVL
jgi:hypothetical protein